MYLLSTAHMIVDLVRVIQAFIDAPEGALDYYGEIWTWLSIFKQALYGTNNIIADSVVIYRCYVVWGFSIKIIIIPVIMLIATSVCAYTAVYNFSQVTPGGTVFAQNIVPWGTALFSLSLATNVTVTTLIAVRIWWLARQTIPASTLVTYYEVVTGRIESGSIYSACIMTLLILYCRDTNAQYIVYDSLSQIMGIVPTLIIVRVGLGITTEDVGTFAASTFRAAPLESHPRPVRFHMEITQTTDIEDDGYELRKEVK
ncbi:hypothetical protein EVJ58_g8668 [Rhodofomes roseus]|uniref:Uncharacterized protein n=1 Tax=Rhodofomes roseus TaxID=34475 RepID=A0A4Y9Y052_9APHY|nr:hypothetical protein EVJ58_g8668 [Rhodofomes roseus]